MEQFLGPIAHGWFHRRQYASAKASWKTESSAAGGGWATYSVKHDFRFQRDTAGNRERRDILMIN
jgi:hypothetical protein